MQGLLFTGTHGFVTAPEGTAGISSDREGVKAWPTIRSKSGALLLSTSPGPATLLFTEGERLSHTCKVNVVAFDPAKHDLSSISEGNCEWATGQNHPFLTDLGHYYARKVQFLEVSVGHPGIADVSPLTDSSMYIIGGASGVTNILFLDKDGEVQGLCPVVVEEATTYFDLHWVDEDQICKDRAGNSIRLAPADRAVVQFDVPGLREFAVAQPRIANIDVQSSTKVSVKAEMPGITNITALKSNGALGDICMIIVE
ncbi:MAG: pilus assembly protein N-terminal domain-containing protein [Pseudomonadota bacterium]